MKGFSMKQFKKTLMAGGLAVALTASVSASAGGNTGAYIGIAANAASIALTLIFPPPWVVIGVNIDAAQIVAEYMVYKAMKETEFVWDPEPAEEYQQAAQSNGSGGGGGGASMPTYSSMIQKLPFIAASLQNVGIEAVDVGPELAEIASQDARSKVLENLGWLQEKGSATTSSEEAEANPGAGSCTASYSVCLRDMTAEEENAVSSLQRVNEQNYGTAGITHAELGLKSVQQAIANDGGSSVGKAGTASSSENVTLAAGKKTSVQDLSKLIGTGANTVAAMKIVSLMNLELAQRLNQGNMMQGSALTIEAARAFQNTSGITD